MKVSKYCFGDDELQRFVESSAVTDVCDVTGNRAPVVDLDDLMDFFEELVGVFKADPAHGQSLLDTVQDDWSLFANTNIARTILAEVFLRVASPLTVDTLVCYKHEVAEVLGQWDSVKESLKGKKRFFTEIDEFATGTKMLSDFITDKQDLTAGTALYRARLIPQDKVFFRKTDMRCPPKNLTTAGRANPTGIPYLYLSQDIETTFYEIRATFLDRLSVGKFLVRRNLKMVDFTRSWSLYFLYSDDNSVADAIIKLKLFSAFSEDLSKPLRRFDTELEYVPTQYLCEYCKTMGADAICFNSSLHSQGVNFVLFNPDDAECVDVKKHIIRKVLLEDKA